MTTNDDARAVARTKILDLVKQFKDNSAHYKDAKKFDEAKTRVGFIDPFFEALGWDLKAGQRLIGKAREVIIEDRAGHGNRRRPDYGFYIDGQLQFYVEAKQPSKDLANDNDSAFQLKSYVWSERGRLGILTDFEEFIVFHGAFKPRREKREMGRVTQLCMTYEEYEKNFDLIYDTFSRSAVESGSLDRLLAQTLASNVRQKNQLESRTFLFCRRNPGEQSATRSPISPSRRQTATILVFRITA
jgi:predicted type IV restriction endonuclease